MQSPLPILPLPTPVYNRIVPAAGLPNSKVAAPSPCSLTNIAKCLSTNHIFGNGRFREDVEVALGSKGGKSRTRATGKISDAGQLKINLPPLFSPLLRLRFRILKDTIKS